MPHNVRKLAARIRNLLGRTRAGPPATPDRWQDSLALFFSRRAAAVNSQPTLGDLCHISGREPRLWTQPELVDDLAASIIAQLAVDAESTVLEVGCASGFIAQAVAPRVKRYIGVDLSAEALDVARRLGLGNAEFRRSDASRLPFPDSTFDGALCYDVFTNFPRFSDGTRLIAEMVRVVRPGGRMLVGSIPDAAVQVEYERRVAEVTSELERRFGPIPVRPEDATADPRTGVTPGIVCYYFNREDFVALAAHLGVGAHITDIHELNPYRGYRFNVVYRKPPA
jgi:SAM-dependent methyltransferase